jgi:hypothetical protein
MMSSYLRKDGHTEHSWEGDRLNLKADEEDWAR